MSDVETERAVDNDRAVTPPTISKQELRREMLKKSSPLREGSKLSPRLVHGAAGFLLSYPATG